MRGKGAESFLLTKHRICSYIRSLKQELKSHPQGL